MFRWYENADICFVYMFGVSMSSTSEKDLQPFAGSQWFDRGWTLQKLLAPPSVFFFDQSC
jgi:hypothetical protein